MMTDSSKINIIDCTLRDGGYYNNWNFSKKLIKKYLLNISKTEVKHIEIGFLTLPHDHTKGFTANCNSNFFKEIKIPRSINIGIMINASDFLRKDLDYVKIIKILKKIPKSKVNFIRIACHFKHLFKITKYFKFLKKRGFKMFLNIMQISDIPNADIKKTCKTYKKLADVIYFADSFGSLNQSSFNLIIEKFKKNSFINLGIHAHDNMKNALSNTINASKKNVRWLDSTILGMGRGPGNTKTEELINYLYGNNSNSYKQIKKILKEFNLLKIIYKWGTNKYYYIAGKYKIHPTYVQMLLSDSRYKNFNFYKILNNLKKLDTSKFDPNTLYLAMNFFNNNNMINSNDNKIDFKKNIIIFGNGNSLKNKKIFKKKIFNNATRVLINRSNFISPDYVDLVVYCHPLRLIADIDFLNKNKSNILLPYNNIPKMIQSKLNKKKVINFDLKLGKDIRLNKNCIILPKPLSLIYSIGYLISKDVKKIYLAGFDGYAPDDPFVDETRAFLIYLKKNIKNLEIKFLTKSKYKLN